MEQLWFGTMMTTFFTIFYVRYHPYNDVFLMYLQTTAMVLT